MNRSNINKIVGWLVSYEMDKLGKAFEIRTGRTIISGEGGDGTHRIVVDREDISEPHLALKATPKHTVLIQDIFSESGSWICRGEAGEEKPVNGMVELRHGDWLRVGARTRMQLCLVEGIK